MHVILMRAQRAEDRLLLGAELKQVLRLLRNHQDDILASLLVRERWYRHEPGRTLFGNCRPAD
jgi:hypothetical protein